MAKTLEVKRFMVTYKGEKYGPNTKNGSVIENVDDKTAAKLIKQSKGTIIEQPKAKKTTNNKTDNKVDDNPDNEAALPPVNPEDTNAGK